ncbi:GNAT family N-acetyltransferase [Sulfitobacter sp. SK012]|uniref:GNAT family N-acetyltransferase n=1 Tax=Sulfitobacter sp. SK012 TaxID=1389005 RepID=UPI000E0BAA6C|nr:GNAT family N-acetyltransferase [Sulfitobacter sp. SK012]AXI45963.1 GNAT family N-acetyltransferase [Sulfitobacter sp. SK012]
MDEIEIRRFLATDRDWLVEAHGTHYARDEGFDASFGVLVAQIIDGFIDGHDAEDEAGWVAWRGDQRLGCIFCVRLGPETAKLRLFLLEPKARGLGLGRQMLATCMGFAKQRGYLGMQLWTHESHRSAGALYERNGWTLTNSVPVVSFGQPNIEQTWEITF